MTQVFPNTAGLTASERRKLNLHRVFVRNTIALKEYRMKKAKVFLIIIVISLFSVSLLGLKGPQVAKAEDENPPDSELIQQNAWLLGTEPAQSASSATVFSLSGCNQEFWDNGEFITHPGGGYQGANVSALQTALGMQTYGFTNQYFSTGYHTADDLSSRIRAVGSWIISPSSPIRTATIPFLLPPRLWKFTCKSGTVRPTTPTVRWFSATFPPTV